MASIRFPSARRPFKDAGGTWRPAIKLADGVRVPLADAALAFLLEEGLARREFDPHLAVLAGT